MASSFEYQLSSCVLVVPQHVTGVVESDDVVAAAGGKATQFVRSQEVEGAIYGSLQVISAKSPIQNANVSVVESGADSVARLVRVAKAAFDLAMRGQNAVAVGLNFNATKALAGESASDLSLRFVAVHTYEAVTSSGQELNRVGLKLVFTMAPWVATLSIEPDPTAPLKFQCGVNFNIDHPDQEMIDLVETAESLRQWFEDTVDEVIKAAPDA